ncbi:MAG TPA: hypothetical protein ENI87_00180 [bacterium]|nr:hypothetical protein [bacterium]
MTAPLLPLSTPLLFCLAASAQVLPGDLAITGFSTSAFGIARSGTVTGYATSSFGGGTSQAVLHDPTTFTDFIVGGFGFVGRATITGPGTMTYTPITTNIGTASQLSWDPSGNLIVADAGTDRVRLVTPTGVVSNLSIGPQPWGTTLNCGAYNPITGDIIVGNQGGVYRLAPGTTTGALIAGGLGGYTSNVQFDMLSGDILVTVLQADRLVRIDGNGIVSDVIPPGTVPGPNALQIDDLGNYLIGASQGNVYRVDATGTATLIATNTSPSSTVSGLAFVHGGCSVQSIGTACSSAIGPTSLVIGGDCSIGGLLTTTSYNHSPNVLGVTVLSLAQLPVPLDLGATFGATGCSLYVSPDVLVGGLTDGAGELHFDFASNNTFLGQAMYVQHSALEATQLSSFTSSNAAVVNY